MRRFALAACLAFASPAVFAQEPPPPPHGPRPATISMTGEGTASAAPDMAVLNSGVVTEAKTAREALDANTAAMTKLIDAIKSAGIEPRDIATSGFSVQPRYVYPQPKNDGQQSPPRITGYEVRNNVTVKVRDLTQLGGILDKAVTEGSNQIDGLSFDISKKEELLNEARKKAYADARAKAELYAGAAGVTLGRVRNIAEQGGAFPPPRPMMMRADAMKQSAPVPVEAGEQELSINVTATWEIEP